MLTLADLDRTRRTIPSHLIRQMTGDRLGQSPHDYLWRDMRQCAGINLHQRKLTQLEALRLIAVSVTWQETGQLPKTLVQVNQVANELLNHTILPDLFPALQERTLNSTELRDAIAQMTGRSPSESTLYLWGQQLGVPYKRRGQYTPTQIDRFVAIARISCTRTA